MYNANTYYYHTFLRLIFHLLCHSLQLIMVFPLFPSSDFLCMANCLIKRFRPLFFFRFEFVCMVCVMHTVHVWISSWTKTNEPEVLIDELFVLLFQMKIVSCFNHQSSNKMIAFWMGFHSFCIYCKYSLKLYQTESQTIFARTYRDQFSTTTEAIWDSHSHWIHLLVTFHITSVKTKLVCLWPCAGISIVFSNLIYFTIGHWPCWP